MTSFLIWPNDVVEEVNSDGDTVNEWTTTGLFDLLVLNGYPLHKDPDGGRWDGVLDVAVTDNGTTVIAHTQGPMPREHSMGEASRLFLDWLRAEEA